MSEKLPEGKLVRAGIAGATAVRLSAAHLKHKVKRPFLSAEQHQKNKEKLDDDNAQTLFKALTQLRGTALKIAQMMGLEQGLLPEAYRRELEKSFHQVPPINRVLVRKLILREFDKTPEKLFARFESQAFAAASLGQVHRAKDRNGSELAVKIQYPGIHVAIESDLALIRKLAPGISNTKLVLHTLNEIELRLKEEIDYEIEADNTRWFKENVSLRGVTIPHIYPELSSQRVLTTEYIQGLHLGDWLATDPPQSIRNHAAQLLYDFFIYTSQNLQCLHADPNPGNYLFHEDGSVSVIDFGCIRKMSDKFTALFPKILRSYMNDDAESLFTAYEKMGMSYENFNDAFYQKAIRPFGQWVALPFKTDSFDFGEHGSYSEQGKAPMKRLHDLLKLDYVAEEFIFHNRTIYGLLKIFERMGATVRLRHHWVEK
ncbi:MAG: AarF/ABC1/UbiB kinase family protein [Gammaproteobacteria bacterium]